MEKNPVEVTSCKLKHFGRFTVILGKLLCFYLVGCYSAWESYCFCSFFIVEMDNPYVIPQGSRRLSKALPTQLSPAELIHTPFQFNVKLPLNSVSVEQQLKFLVPFIPSLQTDAAIFPLAGTSLLGAGLEFDMKLENLICSFLPAVCLSLIFQSIVVLY